jgi:hypothetical protein
LHHRSPPARLQPSRTIANAAQQQATEPPFAPPGPRLLRPTRLTTCLAHAPARHQASSSPLATPTHTPLARSRPPPALPSTAPGLAPHRAQPPPSSTPARQLHRPPRPAHSQRPPPASPCSALHRPASCAAFRDRK